MYELILHPRAKRELDRVPREAYERLYGAIHALQQHPRPVGVQKLEGHLHRIRVGDWRVLYSILDQERRVVIARITRRSEKTYRNLS